MPQIQILRTFVQQRLTAAAEEIFELFERTVAEYEETLCRQGKLLDSLFKPDVRLDRTDVQLMLVTKEEVPLEQQQEGRPCLDQDDPQELPNIKEEQGDQWTSQEGENLQGLVEADIPKFSPTPVPVKSEEEGEKKKPQSSQLHHTEEMKTETDGEDRGGPEQDKNLNTENKPKPFIDDETPHSSELEADDSFDRKESGEFKLSLKPGSNPGQTPVGSSEGATTSDHKRQEERSEIQTEVKSFSCSVCDKIYVCRRSLTNHMRLHSEGKISCSVCKKAFPSRGLFVRHMTVHTGEKPFSCSVCGSKFTRKESLKEHTRIHSGEKPFSCSVCGARFMKRANLLTHSRTHTGEKPFGCAVCGARFTLQGSLRYHMRSHTGEKAYSCSVCDKSFTRLINLKKHKCVGESRGSK